MKRISIRKRIFSYILLITLLSLAAIIATSVVCMISIRNEEEKILIKELDRNLSGMIRNKADVMEARLETYEQIIELIADYTHNMFSDRDHLIETGTMIYPPLSSTPKDAFAMTRLFCTEEQTAENMEDELYFYSHLEGLLDPIAKENDGMITTIYLGTKTGVLVSYDKYSYLSVQPGDQDVIYDYMHSAWYPLALEKDGIFYSDLYIDSQGRGLTITIGSPYYDNQGDFQGAVCADIDITAMYNEMISMSMGTGSFSFAVDQEKNIISPDAAEMSKEEYTGLQEEDFDILTAGGSGILEREDAFYIYTPVNKVGWTLCTCIPKSIVMDEISEVDRSISTAWLIFCLIAGAVLIAVILVSRKLAKAITHPIEMLGKDMERITNGDLEHKSTAIRNDEVGDMSNRLNEMVSTLKAAMRELSSSQKHAEELSELANKDALTGVRNRTAYDRYMERLQQELAEGDEKFGLAMADLNYLKIINDNYGHYKGNVAIQKFCGTLCDVFGHSPVFRIGGDEFVVILKGHDYDNCAELVLEFDRRLETLRQDDTLEEWEKISAAIGFALYDAALDRSPEDVSIRADKAMYDRKKEMKSGSCL